MSSYWHRYKWVESSTLLLLKITKKRVSWCVNVTMACPFQTLLTNFFSLLLPQTISSIGIFKTNCTLRDLILALLKINLGKSRIICPSVPQYYTKLSSHSLFFQLKNVFFPSFLFFYLHSFWHSPSDASNGPALTARLTSPALEDAYITVVTPTHSQLGLKQLKPLKGSRKLVQPHLWLNDCISLFPFMRQNIYILSVQKPPHTYANVSLV